jgi:hypothetical protein
MLVESARVISILQKDLGALDQLIKAKGAFGRQSNNRDAKSTRRLMSSV